MQNLTAADAFRGAAREIDGARARASAHQLPRRVLHRVDRTAAAETHHRIGADAPRLRHQFGDRLRRHVLRRAGEHAGQRGTRRTLDLVEQFRVAERLAGDDQRALRAAARQFASERFDFAGAEDDSVESREMIFASGLVHFCLLWCASWSVALF